MRGKRWRPEYVWKKSVFDENHTYYSKKNIRTFWSGWKIVGSRLSYRGLEISINRIKVSSFLRQHKSWSGNPHPTTDHYKFKLAFLKCQRVLFYLLQWSSMKIFYVVFWLTDANQFWGPALLVISARRFTSTTFKVSSLQNCQWLETQMNRKLQTPLQFQF